MSKRAITPPIEQTNPEAYAPTPAVTAWIAISEQIEAADIKPSARHLARTLLSAAKDNDGHVVTNHRQLWRIIKKLGPDDGKLIADINRSLIQKTLDELASAGILGYSWDAGNIYCGFFAWPRPTPNKPIDNWIAVGRCLPTTPMSKGASPSTIGRAVTTTRATRHGGRP